MIALAVVAAQYAGTFDAMVTARGDARVNQPANQVTVGGRQEEIAIASDATFNAAAMLHVHDRYWDFYLAYTPSFVVPDLELQLDHGVQQDINPTLLNGGSGGIRWHDRFSWFSLNESGAYGLISTTIPYTGAPTTPIPQQQTPGMPTQGMTPTMTMTPSPGMTSMTPGQTTTEATIFKQQDVQYGASSTGLALGTRFGRVTTATLSGSYALSGGLGDTNTTVLPYTAGPLGALLIATRVSPSEILSTMASGNDSYMNGECPLYLLSNARIAAVTKDAMTNNVPVSGQQPCVTRSDTVKLQEGYRRQLSEVGTASATIGVAGIAGPVLGGGNKLGIAPIFAINYTQTLYTYWPGTLVVTLNVSPNVDLLTSVVSDVATAVGTLNARVTKMVMLALSLTATRSIPIPSNDSPLTSVAGSIEGRFRLNKQADVVVGNQEYWQNQMTPGVAGILPAQSFSSFTALAYVGVTLRAPRLHF